MWAKEVQIESKESGRSEIILSKIKCIRLADIL